MRTHSCLRARVAIAGTLVARALDRGMAASDSDANMYRGFCESVCLSSKVSGSVNVLRRGIFLLNLGFYGSEYVETSSHVDP